MAHRRNILYFVLLTLLLTNSIFAQSWSKSFTAGNTDPNGKFLGGSEVLQLISHKKKLFASVGYWQDANNIWYGGTNTNKGWGQIIRLDTPNGQWEEDHFLGASVLRPEVLKQVVFTKDALGNTLFSPDTVLIAAGYSVNYISNIVTVKSFTRNDINGSWSEGIITQGGFPAGENYSIRDIEVYTDQVTGIERIYASVGTKGLFVGKYNPTSPSKIDWISTPEFSPLSIRPLGITTVNNTLYFSSGNKLYRRSDGTSPSYSVAHDFSDLSTNINSAVGGIRGLTTIANPNGTNEALLLMWCPDGQSKGVVYRLEPNGTSAFTRVYETKISVLVESYLPGTSVSYVLGAYNEFYKYLDPITSDTIHVVGLEAQISGAGIQTWNGYYKGGLIAKRKADISYSLEEINGGIHQADSALVATRCSVTSPFENEVALYFGGFDPNGFGATNKAWIYKKTYPTNTLNEEITTESSTIVYPVPASDFIHLKNYVKNDFGYDIHSLQGKFIRKGIVDAKNPVIDIRDLPSSFYILKIGNELYKFIKN